jgi:uncharacterized cofD-like protein
MLPGLKRWILIILICIAFIVYGGLIFAGIHPTFRVWDWISDLAKELHYRVTGLIVMFAGALLLFFAVSKMTLSVLGAYLPSDRESIPDVLYRKRHLDRGPRVVVVGGGTGLSNLLKGLKNFTNNITAIVTVGDDGGSSGRLRQELGVLPPGDIRNCITALADEEKMVTELFRYRFDAGEGLEGHSFGNLFLTAICAITDNDMLEATRVASRVLNSCGQVLPSTLSNVALVAEMEDGRTVCGESQITHAGGRIRNLKCEPSNPQATPEALSAIAHAELIILGPGSLFTSIIPNLLISGVPEAIRRSNAKKIYVCNVMTQEGETIDFTVSDHVQNVLAYSGIADSRAGKLVHAVMVNDQIPNLGTGAEVAAKFGAARPVRYDPERLRGLGVVPVRRSLIDPTVSVHHDSYKLAKAIMMWFVRKKGKRPINNRKPPRPPVLTETRPADAEAPVKTEGADTPVLRRQSAAGFFSRFLPRRLHS